MFQLGRKFHKLHSLIQYTFSVLIITCFVWQSPVLANDALSKKTLSKIDSHVLATKTQFPDGVQTEGRTGRFSTTKSPAEVASALADISTGEMLTEIAEVSASRAPDLGQDLTAVPATSEEPGTLGAKARILQTSVIGNFIFMSFHIIQIIGDVLHSADPIAAITKFALFLPFSVVTVALAVWIELFFH